MQEARTDNGPLLALDVGNTSVKCAARPRDCWEPLCRTPTAPVEGLAERLVTAFPEHAALSLCSARCVVCSVHPAANEAVISFWRRIGGTGAPGFFGADLPVPIVTRVCEPEQVGTDRLLLALGARELAGAPCIVISAGTAITVDLVDGRGCFAGGAIAPGFSLACAALHEKAAFLPLVEPARPQQAVGADTQQAIQSGVYWSCAGGIRALVELYRQRPDAQDAPLICTGSDAELLLPALHEQNATCEPHLIFKGMATALRTEAKDEV